MAKISTRKDLGGFFFQKEKPYKFKMLYQSINGFWSLLKSHIGHEPKIFRQKPGKLPIHLESRVRRNQIKSAQQSAP
jgi:hypothetical protein